MNSIFAKNLDKNIQFQDESFFENKDNFPYRQSTCAIILDDKKRILLIQKVSYQDNQWVPPGGGVDLDETPEQAILRELSEELGLNEVSIIKKSDYIDRYDWPNTVIMDNLIKKNILFRGQEVTGFLIHAQNSSNLNLQKEELKNSIWVERKLISKYLIFPNQLEKMEKLLSSLGI